MRGNKCKCSTVQPWGDGTHRCMICRKDFVPAKQLASANIKLRHAISFISYENMPEYEKAIKK